MVSKRYYMLGLPRSLFEVSVSWVEKQVPVFLEWVEEG